MKTKLIFSLLTAMILVGCGDTSTSGETINTSTVNDDIDDESDSSSVSVSVTSHNQGRTCLTCHAAPADSADGKDFLSGGTIYSTLNGTTTDTYASGYTIRTLLDTGLAINYTYEREGGTGNSYSENSALSSDYDFTAQVLNANNEVVNSSGTNSHNTSSHLNCNSCHTSSGENGAPGRIIFK